MMAPQRMGLVSVFVGAASVAMGYGFGIPWSLVAIVAILIMVAVVLIPRTLVFLSDGQQLRVQELTEKVVYNGPGVFILNPIKYSSAVVVNAESLGTMDYVKIRDTITGKEFVEQGPQLIFLKANEQVEKRGQGMTLTKTEYVIVSNQLTGEAKLVKGPCVWFPTAHENHSQRKNAIALQEDEFIRIKDDATGNTTIRRGKDLVFLEPTCRVDGAVHKCWTLKAYEFVRLLDSLTGKVTVHRGEATIFPNANEVAIDGNKLMAIELKSNEYVKIMEKTTSDVRVVTGPNLVFLGANEELMEPKQAAVEVDDERAVLVRDASSGQQRLVTEKQLFFPGPNDNIVEIRSLIRLADHEAVIIKDGSGNMHFHYGDPKKNADGKAKAFFLPPYSEVVQLVWSGGLRRAKRDLRIDRFDCRPQFMWNEIDCRTTDNVELVLETTIFWEVINLAQMVRSTGNLPADIYNQIRSQFIKHVARYTLKGFMEDLHSVSREIFEEDRSFYETRGVTIHSLEVTKYQCAEKRTSEVLQQIIEETTNRLNRLSQAESENEVRLYKMQGQIEQEKVNGDLLKIQHDHAKAEAAVAGVAEAERVAAFLENLKKQVPDLQERIHMWQVLRKTDALNVVSQGGASLYYTPNDVDLSIKCEGKRD
jgi:regulator of protease activity HflC (stomatin/prohibitin superfamily)